MQAGDRLLLCSDGLWGSGERRGDHRAAGRARPISDAVPELVEQALRNGGAEERQRDRPRGRVGRRRGQRQRERHLDAERSARRCSPRPSRPACSAHDAARRARRSRDRALDPRDQRGDPALVAAKENLRGTPMSVFNARKAVPPDALRPVTITRHYTQACRRLGAGRVRRHAGAVHRVGRGKGAAAQARQRRRLGHRRIRHAAARHAHAQRPRGGARQAERPHAGDPAPDRPLAALRVRPGGARRAHDHARLRRDPGRRRHAHRGDHRRLRRCARRGDAG